MVSCSLIFYGLYDLNTSFKHVHFRLQGNTRIFPPFIMYSISCSEFNIPRVQGWVQACAWGTLIHLL